ncbi:uncharacterized protein LOC125898246 isoform X2 [Epinephelus fuscoguttatus]|uniref:uncharacterized protein LOC125898246 isoform X2 n=1 Tax=Epinephelus fuscoguttatus TaxID=293821 RepID=UPI0020D140C1|nr:uncharacterized protein LOC125898246 isoform X2 [Epinephelus fuscoguttatus]
MSSYASDEKRLCAETKMSAASHTLTREKACHRMKGIIFTTSIMMSSRKIPEIIMSNRKIQSTATSAQTEECLESDLNYASLDLKMAKKRMKKNRHQQGHAQARNTLEEELPGYLTTPANAFLEVEADMDAHLPSRDTSTMVSHSSIYLNSQQIAQEAEEMERENAGWEGIRKREDGRSGDWKRDSEEREDRKHSSNGSVCTQLSEIEAVQSGMDHFISSFSHNSGQQD